MKTASVSHTKNNLSALIDRVKEGETIVIVDRDRPVARLEPVPSSSGTAGGERVARLERAGLVRRGSGKRVRAILEEPPPRARKGADILQTLLAEREESR
jgi:prevent-host-death family protein